jgi:hypothetical protein
MFKKKTIIFGLLLFLSAAFFCADGRTQPFKETPARPVSFTDVKIADAFWAPRQERNRAVTIPFMMKTYKELSQTPWSPFLEGAAYTLVTYPDPELENEIAGHLDRIAGELLNQTPKLRWKHLLNGDLISAGHFFEAAVAFFQSTGSRKYLDAAVRIADDIDSVFGPGKRRDVSNHEEVKIGLIRLYQLTGNEKYLKLARFFLDERGRAGGHELYGEYGQDHEPAVDQREAVGHAVRAMYLYAPLTELAALTGDEAYIRADDAIWEDAVTRKTYLTGGVGSHRDFEDFGDPYELPNLGAWNETCAANGSVLWNQRMFLYHRDAKYIDVLERVLYNGFLAGVGLGGDRFLYQNPLKTAGGFTRQPWFGPNCCPPNVVRGIALVGNYVYAVGGPDVYVNLFVAGKANIRTALGAVTVRQETRYPWDGEVKLTVEPEKAGRFSVFVRVPGWARDEAFPGGLYRFLGKNPDTVALKVNGDMWDYRFEKGYARIEREWKAGDVIEIGFPMPVRRVLADERVADDRGMTAIQRGPLIYCAEACDNGGSVSSLLIPDDAALSARFEASVLNGIAVIGGKVQALSRGKDRVSVVKEERDFRAVPYYAWGNRADGEMSVWLARDPSKVRLLPVPSIASTSRASSSCGNGSVDENYPGGKAPSIAERFYPRAQSGGAGPEALSDQVEPAGSADGSGTYFRLRPRKGDTAWVQYDFKSPAEVSSTAVYWKDDGELCVPPKSWEVFYRKDGNWVLVTPAGPFPAVKDGFNSIEFEKVRTDGLRLVIKLNGRLYEKGPLGPPDGNYLKEDLVWYECGLVEWTVSGG